jgi:hypothetical protein
MNPKYKRSYGKCLFVIVAVIPIVLVGVANLLPQGLADVGLPPLTLDVVALNGTQVVLHESDIANFVSYTAYGGYVKSNGVLAGLGNYTGVPITTLLGVVGGIMSGYSVTITAIDNYTKTLTYNNLSGTGLLTFDNATGQPVQHNQTLTPMLAYYYNGANLTSGGPLRLAIVGPEGLLTQSSLWVSNVVRLYIHPSSLQPMNLSVVGSDGTGLTLNETTISNLPAIRAVGAYINKIGIVKGLGNYTGPSLNTFCNLVGGMTGNTVLWVVAADNYTQILTYDMVNGAFATYDPANGNPVQHNQSLTPVLAYYCNDANLTSGGPLRLAIVGPEGLATGSSYWVSQVVKLQIVQRYDITFGQTGVYPDFLGPAITIDGTNYTTSDLPVSFSWDRGSFHTFAFQSPIIVGSGAKEYDWASTNGLSSSQSGSITVNSSGSVIGDYVTRVHDVAVTNVTSNRTWVYQGFGVGLSVTVLNKGDFDENVNVTLYYNITSGETIGTQNITILTGENGTVSFVWDTKGVAYCQNYTITAVAAIPADTNLTDNTLACGPITVRILGDINGDGTVDLKDVYQVAQSYGTVLGDKRWNSDADMNGDGQIDLLDYYAVCLNFGK